MADVTDASLHVELAALLAPVEGELTVEMLKAICMGQLRVIRSMRKEIGDLWGVIVRGSIRHDQPPTAGDWEWVRRVLDEINADELEPDATQEIVNQVLHEALEDVARQLGVVLDALEGMVAQHCAGEHDLAEHQFISANEAAFDVLLAARRLAYVGLEVYRFTTEEERQ